MNASFVELPNALMAHLIGQYGDPQRIDHLGGHTRALVRCIWFEQKSLVIKATSNDREVSFYGTIAPVLRKEGVPIPDLEWIHQEAEHSWMLVLEHIPLKLPRDRWLADPEILQALFRLHTYSGRQQTDSVFHPVWSDEMTTGAASYFPEPIKEKLQHLLDQMRIKAVHLLEPLCWISGDPNPTNWGLRLNDQATLFDWERFGRGHPALDLAITIPGLGREADFHRVAAEYLKGTVHWHSYGATDDVPARATLLTGRRLSKVGGQTQFCNSYAAHDDLPAAEQSYYESLRVVHSLEAANRLMKANPSEQELAIWRRGGSTWTPTI